MPDPVSCHAPAPGTSLIQCDDITFGPEPPRTQQVDVPEGAAGARALVQSHTPPLLVHYGRNPSEPIDVPYEEIAKRCAASTIAGVAVMGGAATAHPIFGALTALKTGIEISQCVGETIYDLQRKANEQRAVENCVTSGGTPVGIADDMLTCERAVPEPLR